MAKDSDPARQGSPRAAPPPAWGARSVYGPQPLGQVLPRVTRPVFRKRSPGAVQLMADWDAVVGPQLARATTPRRLTGRTLTIACAGPAAMELTHLAPQLIARINAHLGRVIVDQLRFVQMPGPPPEAPAPPPAAVTVPDRVAAAVAEVPGEALREALAKLARGVYRRRS